MFLLNHLLAENSNVASVASSARSGMGWYIGLEGWPSFPTKKDASTFVKSVFLPCDGHVILSTPGSVGNSSLYPCYKLPKYIKSQCTCPFKVRVTPTIKNDKKSPWTLEIPQALDVSVIYQHLSPSDKKNRKVAEDLVRQRLGLSAGDVVIPPLEGFTEDKMPYNVVGGLSTVSEAENNVSESSPPPECNMSVTDVHRAYLQQEIGKDPNASSQTLQASFEKSFHNEPQLSPDKRQEFLAKLNTSIAYQKRQYFEKSGEFLKSQTIVGLQKLVEKSNLVHHGSARI